MSAFASRPDDLLRAFSRMEARPGQRVDYLALIRSGLPESEVSAAVRSCASRGYVVDCGFAAELTEAGYRAIADKGPPLD
jgi:hypothetical protein